MFVSILQRMAWGWLQPIQSRAGENPGNEPSKVNNKGITQVIEDHKSLGEAGSGDLRDRHAPASTARRQEVKEQPRSPKTPVKLQKSSVKAKPVSKAASKPAAKVGKPVVKKAVASKAAARKPVVTGVAKTAMPAKTALTPPAKKKAAAPVKSSTKPASKVARVIEKPSAKAALAAKPVESSMPIPTVTPAPAPKRSSRLAQLTVPSMAPAVASTAAKSSYSQTTAVPVFAPAPHVAARKNPKLADNWKAKTAEQLSDEEVIAMPDSEYMNEKQLAFFRLKLLQLKMDILNSAGETTEHLRADTVVVPDPADRATIEEEHALELRTRDRERKLLKKIEQSIQQIDAGDYGYCDETGEPIGVQRLLARPTATLSLEAQQRRELKQKMFGD
jgi:DnaK suppressor protein